MNKIKYFLLLLVSSIAAIFVHKSSVPRLTIPGVTGMLAKNADALTMSQYTRFETSSDGINIVTTNRISINSILYNNIPNHVVSVDGSMVSNKVIYLPVFQLVATFTADINSGGASPGYVDVNATTNRGGGNETIHLPKEDLLTLTPIFLDGTIVTSLTKSKDAFYGVIAADKIVIGSAESGNFFVLLSRQVKTDYEIPNQEADELGVDFEDDKYTFSISVGNTAPGTTRILVYGQIFYVGAQQD